MTLDKFRSSANRLKIPEIVSEPVLYVFKNATCSFSLQIGIFCFEFDFFVTCNTSCEVLSEGYEILGVYTGLIHGSTGLIVD